MAKGKGDAVKVEQHKRKEFATRRTVSARKEVLRTKRVINTALEEGREPTPKSIDEERKMRGAYLVPSTELRQMQAVKADKREARRQKKKGKKGKDYEGHFPRLKTKTVVRTMVDEGVEKGPKRKRLKSPRQRAQEAKGADNIRKKDIRQRRETRPANEGARTGEQALSQLTRQTKKIARGKPGSDVRSRAGKMFKSVRGFAGGFVSSVRKSRRDTKGVKIARPPKRRTLGKRAARSAKGENWWTKAGQQRRKNDPNHLLGRVPSKRGMIREQTMKGKVTSQLRVDAVKLEFGLSEKARKLKLGPDAKWNEPPSFRAMRTSPRRAVGSEAATVGKGRLPRKSLKKRKPRKFKKIGQQGKMSKADLAKTRKLLAKKPESKKVRKPKRKRRPTKSKVPKPKGKRIRKPNTKKKLKVPPVISRMLKV